MTKLSVLLVVGVVCVVSGLAGAQDVVESPPEPANLSADPQPKIKFESMSHNFGRVLQNETVIHDFIFENVGEAFLDITNVHAGCGCTVVQSSTGAVPGATGFIRAKFNTAGMRGVSRKSVSVTSNDPTTPRVTLMFEADVYQEISMVPDRLHFGMLTEDATDTRSLLIIANKGVSLNLEEPVVNVDWLTVTVTPTDPPPEHAEETRYQLVATMNQSLPVGLHHAIISVKTDNEKTPMLNVPIELFVVKPMYISPDVIELGPVQVGQEATATVVISNRDERIHLGEPAIHIEGAHVLRSMLYEGDRATLTLSLTPEHENVASEGTFEMHTNHPSHHHIQIPIRVDLLQ